MFEDLEVVSEVGVAIEGVGQEIVAMDDQFELSIFGVAYSFYRQEFPHHVQAYERQFTEDI